MIQKHAETKCRHNLDRLLLHPDARESLQLLRGKKNEPRELSLDDILAQLERPDMVARHPDAPAVAQRIRKAARADVAGRKLKGAPRNLPSSWPPSSTASACPGAPALPQTYYNGQFSRYSTKTNRFIRWKPAVAWNRPMT